MFFAGVFVYGQQGVERRTKIQIDADDEMRSDFFHILEELFLGTMMACSRRYFSKTVSSSSKKAELLKNMVLGG